MNSDLSLAVQRKFKIFPLLQAVATGSESGVFATGTSHNFSRREAACQPRRGGSATLDQPAGARLPDSKS